MVALPESKKQLNENGDYAEPGVPASRHSLVSIFKTDGNYKSRRLCRYKNRCMYIDMDQITPAQAAWASDCQASTLRAWHNRLGLLSRENDGTWRRYTVAEVLQIRLVVVLTARGIVAADAVEIANNMKELAEESVQGLHSYVGIGKREGECGYEVLKFPGIEDWGKPYRFTDALAWFDEPVFIVVNLGALATEVWLRLRGGS